MTLTSCCFHTCESRSSWVRDEPHTQTGRLPIWLPLLLLLLLILLLLRVFVLTPRAHSANASSCISSRCRLPYSISSCSAASRSRFSMSFIMRYFSTVMPAAFARSRCSCARAALHRSAELSLIVERGVSLISPGSSFGSMTPSNTTDALPAGGDGRTPGGLRPV